MQSYLQYRNLGSRLKTQIKHNIQKEPALDPNEEKPTANPTIPKDEVSDSADPCLH
jgi:hypothetical protein